MKRKLGIILIILGCGLITAALALYLHNQQEDRTAAAASQEAIVKVVEVIRENKKPETPIEDAAATVPTAPEERRMTTANIDGYDYIGFVGMPSLGLELPVMADWAYTQLKIAPCRYTGSIFTDDLVIMAHNYTRHFGKIRRMKAGDTVTFTDMDGDTIEYQVAAVEILGPAAVEDMTAGDYDLTLFTCTYGGENRVTVRCDRQRQK